MVEENDRKLKYRAALGTTLQIVDLPYCHFVFKRINLLFLLYFVVLSPFSTPLPTFLKLLSSTLVAPLPRTFPLPYFIPVPVLVGHNFIGIISIKQLLRKISGESSKDQKKLFGGTTHTVYLCDCLLLNLASMFTDRTNKYISEYMIWDYFGLKYWT